MRNSLLYSFVLIVYASQSCSAGGLNSNIEIGGRRGGIDENIPVIEIRGEGAPMSSAQIRHLEELDNGGPLDIKIEKTYTPAKCPEKAKRLDFVTFHYKVFTEDNKKVYQSYGSDPVTIQLGTGMIIPGLDKGLRGMCGDELRKIQVPYRLSRKGKSRVWKHIPNDENWLTFNIEIIDVRPYTHHEQFKFIDLNNNTFIDADEVVNFQKKMRKDFGKSWKNEDIDNVAVAKYYIRYFDVNNDGKVTEEEWIKIMERDEAEMEKNGPSKDKGKKRDPAIGWILDFNNDGIVSYKELDEAAELIENGPTRLPSETKDEL